jgi:hypothetical protein
LSHVSSGLRESRPHGVRARDTATSEAERHARRSEKEPR